MESSAKKASASRKKVAPQAPTTFIKHSPLTGEELGEFQITTAEEVEQAVARAREAFPAWRDLGVKTRLQKLDGLRQIIQENGEEYAKRISADTGKPLVDSLMTELMSIPLFIDYYRRTAPRALRRKKVRTPILFPGKKSYIEHFPMGVIAVISPWNFPFQLAMVPVISALIAGNTVVLKPSEVTPLTGELILEIFDRLGLPQGVIQVLQGDGSTGAALTRADVDKIFFTGSVATGRKIMAEAAKKPIPVELELGGKDAMIVCADANLERAAKAAVWGGFLNCGQMCVSVERLFVVESVYDPFITLVKKEMDAIKVGAPEDFPDIGPLTFGNQIDTVERHIASAVAQGATVGHGGKRIDGPGQFFEPTLLLGVTPTMDAYLEETFGPLLPVIKVRDEDEAIRLANDHEFGLTGSVWTGDKSRGLELASRLECGQALVNDLVVSVGNPTLPFGGVKSSGFGRYHGVEGLYAFMNQKAIMVDKGRGASEPFWFPYDKKYGPTLDAFDGLVRGNLLKAMGALMKLRKINKDAR